jgi:hypothetical protein
MGLKWKDLPSNVADLFLDCLLKNPGDFADLHFVGGFRLMEFNWMENPLVCDKIVQNLYGKQILYRPLIYCFGKIGIKKSMLSSAQCTTLYNRTHYLPFSSSTFLQIIRG